MSTKNKVQHIEILRVERKRRVIVTRYLKGGDTFKAEEHDNPLPSFVAAFDALAPLVAIICHLPGEFTATNFRVTGIDFGQKGGAPTVAITGRKAFDDAAKEMDIVTPERLLTHPSEEGTYSPPLTAAQAELVEEAREQSKRYLLGERAQGLLDFGGPKGDDEEGGEGEDQAERDAKVGQAQLNVGPVAKKRGRKK